MQPKGEKFTIMVLTNKNSDNVGDQVMEVCDKVLVRAIMKNLGIEKKKYTLLSKAASIVPRKAVLTGDKSLLATAENTIKDVDLIIFGGAPMFNWHHQIFYERTAIVLELAEKHNVPVIFSAIGVEGFDATDERCQRIQSALKLSCVKQITTRDDLEALEKYVEGTDVPIARVADPAVFSKEIFKNFMADKKEKEKKKIGIFTLRANGFLDNDKDLPPAKAAEMWVALAKAFETAGYDCEFITSGHFADEAFLNSMVERNNVPSAKCHLYTNDPETLVSKIAEYDGVISTRLHPSIISYSLGVPAVGLVWNDKVSYFYESIGYGNRYVEVADITPKQVLKKLEEAMEQGVDRDQEYVMTVYNTLFDAMKKIVAPESDKKPYTFQELEKVLAPFKGTTQEGKEAKMCRKLRRTYREYNANVKLLGELRWEMKRFRESVPYKVTDKVTLIPRKIKGKLKK